VVVWLDLVPDWVSAIVCGIGGNSVSLFRVTKGQFILVRMCRLLEGVGGANSYINVTGFYATGMNALPYAERPRICLIFRRENAERICGRSARRNGLAGCLSCLPFRGS